MCYHCSVLKSDPRALVALRQLVVALIVDAVDVDEDVVVAAACSSCLAAVIAFSLTKMSQSDEEWEVRLLRPTGSALGLVIGHSWLATRDPCTRNRDE